MRWCSGLYVLYMLPVVLVFREAYDNLVTSSSICFVNQRNVSIPCYYFLRPQSFLRCWSLILRIMISKWCLGHRKVMWDTVSWDFSSTSVRTVKFADLNWYGLSHTTPEREYCTLCMLLTWIWTMCLWGITSSLYVCVYDITLSHGMQEAIGQFIVRHPVNLWELTALRSHINTMTCVNVYDSVPSSIGSTNIHYIKWSCRFTCDFC
jgi:hypothetical protein